MAEYRGLYTSLWVPAAMSAKMLYAFCGYARVCVCLKSRVTVCLHARRCVHVHESTYACKYAHVCAPYVYVDARVIGRFNVAWRLQRVNKLF